MRQLSTKRQSRALAFDQHNATNTDKHSKAALSPRPTKCDRYRHKRKSRALTLVRHNATNTDTNAKASPSPLTDTMRQIPTKSQSRTLPSTDKMRQLSTKTLHSAPRRSATKSNSTKKRTLSDASSRYSALSFSKTASSFDSAFCVSLAFGGFLTIPIATSTPTIAVQISVKCGTYLTRRHPFRFARRGAHFCVAGRDAGRPPF